jgi:hypothetical protein
MLAELAYDGAERLRALVQRLLLRSQASSQPGLGYVAPPLDGVWATAPYLHNGSVPTLAALLDTDARPTYWRFDGAEPDYDQTALGWDLSRLAQGREQFASLEEQKWVYDTTRPGFGNQGHDFGDELSDDERGALLGIPEDALTPTDPTPIPRSHRERTPSNATIRPPHPIPTRPDPLPLPCSCWQPRRRRQPVTKATITRRSKACRC